MNRHVVPWCKNRLRKVIGSDDANTQGKEAREESNGQFTEPLGKPKLPHLMALLGLFLRTIN